MTQGLLAPAPARSGWTTANPPIGGRARSKLLRVDAQGKQRARRAPGRVLQSAAQHVLHLDAASAARPGLAHLSLEEREQIRGLGLALEHLGGRRRALHL